MSENRKIPPSLPPEQEAIRARCFHPTGQFVGFSKEEVEQSIPERFEKIVRLYPDRPAVESANQVLTYAELNRMTNRLARAILAARGSGAAPIGILLEKGPTMVAAALAALKAGKFFVLLDPAFPQERLRTILQDACAELVVSDSQTSSLSRAVISDECSPLELESVDQSVSGENLRLDLLPTAPAFIRYTSGSTGLPKGVFWIHRHLLHQVMLYTNGYKLCPQDRLSLLSATSGNAVTNTFYPLLSGSALCLFDVRRNGVNALAGWLARERISFCQISAPLFRSLCETLGEGENFPDLRVIRVASEMVYPSDVDLYKRHFAANCLFCTGLSTSETGLLRMFFIDHGTTVTGAAVPLGYAVDDKEISLLDESASEVRLNEVGEIVVRSDYISPGYWRKPDLTKAKFKPASEGGDKRLYFTGDLGLMHADGCLIHKGRKDFRVKVRGYRVEIAEIEKALRNHGAVKEVVVTLRESPSGPRLVAYFTSPTQTSPRLWPSADEIRVWLGETLPDYMIPSAFVRLDAMPLTPNGKVDRGALPDPGRVRPGLDTPYAAARTPTEERLVKIWAEILALNQVGIHDNFFDLGGHSLAASRVVSQVLKQLQLEIPLQSLFQTPTVAEMAVVVTEHEGRKLGEKKLDRLLSDLESLSDDEAERLVGGAPAAGRR